MKTGGYLFLRYPDNYHPGRYTRFAEVCIISGGIRHRHLLRQQLDKKTIAGWSESKPVMALHIHDGPGNGASGLWSTFKAALVQERSYGPLFPVDNPVEKSQ